MVLEFYYDMVSEPCRAIYLFLKLNKVPFEPKEVSIIKGKFICSCKSHLFMIYTTF